MERLNELVQRWESSPGSLQKNTGLTHPENEISIYSGSLSTPCIVENIATIKKAFPGLPVEFYDVLTDRLKANGFNDDRFRDAVGYVVDSCVYPTPTIAQFISYDKRFKIYTYSEYCRLCDEGDGKNYLPVQLPDRERPVWVHINDITKYKLRPFEK